MTIARCCVFVLALVLFASTVAAQSASMPLPTAVVEDADGKVVGQALIGTGTVRLLLDLGQGPVHFYVYRHGLRAVGGGDVYFTGPNCTGQAYISAISSGNNFVEAWQEDRIEVVGPDPSLGTYRVFRATSDVVESYSVLSYWDSAPPSGCKALVTTGTRLPAAEVIPNPLEGYHGPTDTQPERVWTIEGGTKIIPPTP